MQTYKLLACCILWPVAAPAQSVKSLCNPSVSGNVVLVSPAQREAAGDIAQPPLTDRQNGFAWPDTPLGVVKSGAGYAFFGSDGARHARQYWNGHWYMGSPAGSATRTIGTLDNPAGTEPPIDVSIDRNPDPSVNPNYPSYTYRGGGPVYRVPPGMTGAGNLLMVYHAEINTASSFYSLLALAMSTDEGMSWTDLGEIVRINQAYETDLDGFDIGDPPLVVSPDGKYFYIYFRDWLANGTTHWGNTTTLASVARAPIQAVLNDAFGGGPPHAALFEKYYAGSWGLQPGIGGFSTDVNPNAQYTGELQVVYDSALQRYVMIIDEGVIVAYSESPDGLQWTSPAILLYDFREEKDKPNTYAMPAGTGDDPQILGLQFYVYYTRYPTTGAGWTGASVNRFTVTCR